MMNKIKLKLAFGIILMFASLWGGAYIMGILPRDHWAAFPTIFTAFTFFFGGTTMLAGALAKLEL